MKQWEVSARELSSSTKRELSYFLAVSNEPLLSGYSVSNRLGVVLILVRGIACNLTLSFFYG